MYRPVGDKRFDVKHIVHRWNGDLVLVVRDQLTGREAEALVDAWCMEMGSTPAHLAHALLSAIEKIVGPSCE